MTLDTADRRTLKTQAALHTAFLALLLDREYDTIKVDDIVERANVARSTFYEHFRTKDDLLRASMRKPFSVLAELVDLNTGSACEDRVLRLLMHLRAMQSTARILLRWPTRPLLAEVLADLIAERFQKVPDSRRVLPDQVVARQIGDCQLALLECWVHGRPVCDSTAAASALAESSRALATVLCHPAIPEQLAGA
jgi:AcrR family transcriptional regulator